MTFTSYDTIHISSSLSWTMKTFQKMFVKGPLQPRSLWMMSSTINHHTAILWRILGHSGYLQWKGETMFNNSMNKCGFRRMEEDHCSLCLLGQTHLHPPNHLIMKIFLLTHHEHLLPRVLLLKKSLDSESVASNLSIQMLLVEDQMTYLKILHGCSYKQKSPRLVHHPELSPQPSLWMKSLNSSMIQLLPPPLSQPWFFQLLLTSPLFQSTLSLIPTCKLVEALLILQFWQSHWPNYQPHATPISCWPNPSSVVASYYSRSICWLWKVACINGLGI